MLKPYYFILLAALLVDGGVVTPPPPPMTGPDAGTRWDGGVGVPKPINSESIHWPDELRPLATLDGPAVLAAHAALQHLLARLAKEYPRECAYSAKAMEVIVGEAEGLYFVRIDQHVDRCGWADPSFIANPHWWELYAVTPDGRVLAREQYTP